MERVAGLPLSAGSKWFTPRRVTPRRVEVCPFCHPARRVVRQRKEASPLEGLPRHGFWTAEPGVETGSVVRFR